MKKLVAFILLGLVACSRTPDEIQKEISRLEGIEREKQQTVSRLTSQETDLRGQIDNDKLKIHLQNGGRVQYILKLQLKQERAFTTDINKVMKDAMNACTFELPVDKSLYDDVSVGDKILEKFRGGSFYAEGSASSWVIKVEGKRTKLIE